MEVVKCHVWADAVLINGPQQMPCETPSGSSGTFRGVGLQRSIRVSVGFVEATPFTTPQREVLRGGNDRKVIHTYRTVLTLYKLMSRDQGE